MLFASRLVRDPTLARPPRVELMVPERPQAHALVHLRPDTDPLQMLFEVHGLILALHHDARFLRNPGTLDRARRGFARVVADYQPPVPSSQE